MTSDLSIPQPHKGGNRSKANQIARRVTGGLFISIGGLMPETYQRPSRCCFL